MRRAPLILMSGHDTDSWQTLGKPMDLKKSRTSMCKIYQPRYCRPALVSSMIMREAHMWLVTDIFFMYYRIDTNRQFRLWLKVDTEPPILKVGFGMEFGLK
jgi:hypothetical protein